MLLIELGSQVVYASQGVGVLFLQRLLSSPSAIRNGSCASSYLPSLIKHLPSLSCKSSPTLTLPAPSVAVKTYCACGIYAPQMFRFAWLSLGKISSGRSTAFVDDILLLLVKE